MFGGIETKKTALTCGYMVGLPDAKHSEGRPSGRQGNGVCLHGCGVIRDNAPSSLAVIGRDPNVL
jgi:hypothetical protein